MPVQENSVLIPAILVERVSVFSALAASSAGSVPGLGPSIQLGSAPA
jgi:hypothetical protein